MPPHRSFEALDRSDHRQALERSDDGALGEGFFLDLLRNNFSEDEARAQLDTAIGWGRTRSSSNTTPTPTRSPSAAPIITLVDRVRRTMAVIYKLMDLGHGIGQWPTLRAASEEVPRYLDVTS